jgi:hypothetical protein
VIFSRVTPGIDLSSQQKLGLKATSFFQGREIVLAVDTTQSVQLSDEGLLRIQQIVKDTLKNGDSVFIVPFASETDLSQAAIEVKDKNEINKIIDTLPLKSDPSAANTDIQKAEFVIYQKLAQLNQNRLQQKQPVKSQSVVWLTDAPLFTKTGNEWIETPAYSQFRDVNSAESRERLNWLKVLPLQERSQTIENYKGNYKLTIVDIPVTVQEFCTPAPSGQVSCLVDSYLISQLWLPFLGSMIILGSAIALIGLFLWNKGGKLKLEVTTDNDEPMEFFLQHKQKLAIGGFDQGYVGTINCTGSEVRGYLQREDRNFYIVPFEPANSAQIYKDGNLLIKKTKVSGRRINLDCPDANGREFPIEIIIDR